MVAIVESGDWINFNPASKEVTTVHWQQNFSERKELYFVLLFTAKNEQVIGILFVQQSLADTFFKICDEDGLNGILVNGGDKIEVTTLNKGYKIEVASDFQYGENQQKNLRFLVYHDKGNKPFTTRFINSSGFKQIANKIVNMAKEYEAIKPSSKVYEDLLNDRTNGAANFHDYLKDCQGTRTKLNGSRISTEDLKEGGLQEQVLDTSYYEASFS